MGIDSITTTISGESVNPSSREDWRDWVSATGSRNYMLNNTLIDWLVLYGKERGYKDDFHQPTYDKQCDFTIFIMQQGNAFENAIKSHLGTYQPVITIGTGPASARSLDKAEATYYAMKDGEPIIHQGVLRHPDTKTYGSPDFLIRSDVLCSLFPENISTEEANKPAADLNGSPWHYVIVDAKFTTLHLTAKGELGNSGSLRAYKAQLYTYARALSKLQGYQLNQGFLLGRAWEQGSGEKATRGVSAMERLGPATFDSNLADGLAKAEEWIRNLRSNGLGWSLSPKPDVDELWPNVSETSDFPWHSAKMQIAKDLSEVTMLWQVGFAKRKEAHTNGLYSWRDPAVTASALGVSGTRGEKLNAMLEINRGANGPLFKPARVTAGEEVWRKVPEVEFYVDFETVNDLNDDFSKLPMKGSTPLIFMIGCGHVENDTWVFKNFVVDHMDESSEADLINEWVNHMNTVKDRLSGENLNPNVFHWSSAELSFIETSYNSARKRHPEQKWPDIYWYDLLANVAREEPIVVRGALGFGLKTIVNAMSNEGLIDVHWPDSSLDGLGAMAGAWSCEREAEKDNLSLGEIPLMNGIVAYNEIDCKAMFSLVQYLRKHH